MKAEDNLFHADAAPDQPLSGQLNAVPELSEDEMRRVLEAVVHDAGSQKAWARANGLSEQYVCDCLKGRRAIGFSIARALGYQPITVYVRLASPRREADRRVR
jgi:hypothetical protein